MVPITSQRPNVPDEIITEILARLPLRSISRFKTVCRRWKSAVESVHFRRLFVSVHKNSSCGWSLLGGERRELFNFHGCETWGLPKSISGYLEEMMVAAGLYLGAFSFSGLVLVKGANDGTYVGNPVLHEWVVIPPRPYRYPCIPFGLVTSTDKEDGVVLGFKVVYLAAVGPWRDKSSTFVSLCVYSSDTGIWTFKRLRCPLYLTIPGTPISLNGTLYFSQTDFRRRVGDPVAIFAHDFYGDDGDLCRSILLPKHNPGDLKGALTASCGFVMYIKTSLGDDNLLKVWRLNNDDDSWQLLLDIRLQFFHDIRFYVPISMHPYDRNLLYLWSQKNRFLVSCNLKTQHYKNLRDDKNHQGFSLNQSLCEEYMRCSNRSVLSDDHNLLPRNLLQLVLPLWMESMPCPPQLEMMDTTSLLAYIASLPGRK